MEELEVRKAKADSIIANASLYCVCEGCESIVVRSKVEIIPFCPSCEGYHFNNSPERVREIATIIGARPRKNEMLDWREYL